MAILSAVETVNAKIPATIDAAGLCKMADRGQIQGAVIDSPLAFDNAISKEAARIKGIHSPVAGEAEILQGWGMSAWLQTIAEGAGPKAAAAAVDDNYP